MVNGDWGEEEPPRHEDTKEAWDLRFTIYDLQCGGD